MKELEKAILYGVEACIVKIHVLTCPECELKYEEIKKHIKESMKSDDSVPIL